MLDGFAVGIEELAAENTPLGMLPGGICPSAQPAGTDFSVVVQENKDVAVGFAQT